MNACRSGKTFRIKSVGERLRWEAGQTTRAETRCGCFLPGLTGLAREPSAANLPTPIWRAPKRGARGNAHPSLHAAKTWLNALSRAPDLCHLYGHAKQTQFLCRRHARSGIGAAQGPKLDRRPEGGGRNASRTGLACPEFHARGIGGAT